MIKNKNIHIYKKEKDKRIFFEYFLVSGCRVRNRENRKAERKRRKEKGKRFEMRERKNWEGRRKRGNEKEMKKGK